MPNKNYFAQLSPSQKAELFLIYTGNGMYNLQEIMNHYNSEMERAYSSTDKDMVARMHDVNAPYLLDEDGNKMTHRMASDEGYVFPTIQRNDNGDLESYEDTEDWGAQRAIDRGDTLQFKLPSLADYFSRNYKTHLDNPNMHANGGNMYGVGSWIKNIFKSSSDDKSSDKSGGNYSDYLSNDIIEYLSSFKNTDDLLNSNSYANLDDFQKNSAKRWARYYFDNDQRDVEWFKMLYGPKMRYDENRAKYERNEKYDVDMSGLNFKLKSVVNGKPTNKHTMSVNYGLLDFIYDEAVRGGVDPRKAIALATNESNLGNSRMKESKINQFNLYSYWLGTGSVIYPNSKIIDPYNKLLQKFNSGEEFNSKDLEIINDLYSKYNKMADYIHEYKGDNITADAVRDYESGKYLGTNPSKERVDAYHKLVMSRFDELMNDARFVKWWDDKQNHQKENNFAIFTKKFGNVIFFT